MPIVRIEMQPRRGRDEKNALIRNVTDAVVNSIGCPDQAVLHRRARSEPVSAGRSLSPRVERRSREATKADPRRLAVRTP